MVSELKIPFAAGASPGSAIASMLTALGRSLQLLMRAARNRRAAAMLAHFDDRMLSDIGISRSDLHDAYAEPLWRDPTCVLAMRAAERRINRRGLGFNFSGRASTAPSIVPNEGYTRPATNRPSRYSL